MELLRRTATSVFREYDKFEPRGDEKLTLVRLNATGAENATYETESITETDLLSRISEPAVSTSESSNANASLLLVCMGSSSCGNGAEGVGMSKDIFLQLIDALEIDISVFHPLVENMCGFFEYSSSSSSENCTYFIADTHIAVIWSFDFKMMKTRAILVVRGPDRQNQSGILQNFLDSINQLRSHISNPYLLYFVCLIRISLWEAQSREATWTHAREFEHQTEYGQYGRLMPGRPNLSLGDLTVTAKRIDTLESSLANYERHLDIIDSLIAELEDQDRWRRRLGQPGAEQRLKLCGRDIEALSIVLRPLKLQNTAARSAMKYMQARIRSQSQVIFALRAQKESRISLEIAETSRDLAGAAKRDAASMKTIAVMTMAFLPATFFAALFSVPSLRWDQPVVVTDRFWVYWVFTLPVTAFVFLIWLVLSYDDEFRTRLEEYRRKRDAKTSVNEDSA
ncbi:hypothetical protein F5Y19DRAFT_492786 [Xylariaceae sp. FL1651]|nr:hypothetical protein F5Y19DRAFT_492786 [Xylariaceae sp. FL1651]